MKRTRGLAAALRASAAAVAVAALLTQQGLAQTSNVSFEVDTKHSRASFAVTHAFLARVSGSVPILGGSVLLAPGSAVPVSIAATLDPKRIDSGDADRDDDLQGPDWFDTKAFPQWRFVTTSIVPSATGPLEVHGALTVHGVSQPVVLLVAVTRGLPRPAYHATGHVSRHAFGMRRTPTDALVGDDVEMTLDVHLR